MQLFYRTFGEGFPLFILHGLLGMSDNWVRIAKELSKKRQVIIPDLRNHGKSLHSSVMNYDAMVDDMLELLNDLAIKEADFLGHSMGGKIAMQLSQENNNLVKKLIIEDIAPRRYFKSNIELIDIMYHLDIKKIKSRKELENLLILSTKSISFTNLILKNIQFSSSTGLSWKLNINGIYQNLEFIFDEINSHQIFEKPTLFIKGEHSKYILDTDIFEIKNKFPLANFITISKAGHWVHANNPIEFLKMVETFLEKKDSNY